mgnify:CR=1 FL=1
MKRATNSLQFRILLPVIVTILIIVLLMSTMFSRTYINMILQQENEVNAVGFETVSQQLTPLINTSISEVRNIMADERVIAYAGHHFDSMNSMI